LKMRRNKPMLLPIVLKIVILRLFLHLTSFIPIKKMLLGLEATFSYVYSSNYRGRGVVKEKAYFYKKPH
uniref:hypothetical protein n=1 Tax=Dysgonomonas sp. UBA7698 TaxID=1946427 RepID=UPI0025BCBA99